MAGTADFAVKRSAPKPDRRPERCPTETAHNPRSAQTDHRTLTQYCTPLHSPNQNRAWHLGAAGAAALSPRHPLSALRITVVTAPEVSHRAAPTYDSPLRLR